MYKTYPLLMHYVYKKNVHEKSSEDQTSRFFFPNAVYKLCPKEDTSRMIVLSQAPQRSKDIGECKLTLVHKWILGIRLET